MKIVSVVLFALIGVARPDTNCLDFSKWHPPALGEVRSPCPALNALANHHILPHSGKNITTVVTIAAITEAFNFSKEIATTLAFGGLALSRNPASGTFNLDDLDAHNVLEHDASLSRKDFNAGGNDHTFDQDIWNEVLTHWNGTDQITLPLAAAARYGRVQTERARDAKFNYTLAQAFLSYSETASYFRVLNNASSGTTPKDWVKIFFEQERLPYKEGWRTYPKIIDGLVVAQDMLVLELATPEKLSPDGTIGPAVVHGSSL